MKTIPARFVICKQEEVETNHSYPNEILLPKRSTSHSAGYDFYLPYDVLIESQENIIIPTYIKCLDMPEDKVLKIYIRSSLGIKKHLMLSNNTGIIDADYTFCIYISLFNFGSEDILLKKKDRFVQGIFEDYYVLEDDDTDVKRTGGIGSSGN